jgi:phosphomannomutase
MSDGGAAPLSFTKRIEAALPATPTTRRASVEMRDFVSPYLAALSRLVAAETIRNVAPCVLVDPLYGAARSYLAELLTHLGCEVTRIHDEADASFGGLHPEPIPPWTDAAAARARELGIPGFVLDGDADRIGALDEEGTFVPPHKIIALIADHLVTDKGQKGRIVKTLSTSAIVDRVGKLLGCPVTTTPIGFKWIYEEMRVGDVLIGGEESGGIGLPGHVRERDGLLMALLLIELMAERKTSLKALVDALEERSGRLYYRRDDLRLDAQLMDVLRQKLPLLSPKQLAGAVVQDCIHSDGAKFILPKDEWLLLRASGTEPLLRVYAESADPARIEVLLEAGSALAQNPELWETCEA